MGMQVASCDGVVRNSSNYAVTRTVGLNDIARRWRDDWDAPDLDIELQIEPFHQRSSNNLTGDDDEIGKLAGLGRRPAGPRTGFHCAQVEASQLVVQRGQLIAGKYRIERIIGQGGMGTVAAATNIAIDQPVALKFLLPEMVGNATVIERLLREARASAKLRSEHVCVVYDVGSHAGEPFIVMELLDGRDLASMVSTRIALPVALATDYVLQVATGLAEAHALGIVHRDLKPANIFLTRRADKTPLIKVLDFGIAKSPTDRQFNLTRTATIVGSPGYMSPEQLRSSRDVDARSDIWSLGVILYELTAGKPPFVADTITALALRIAMDPMPPLPGVPREFERVVACCLEKDPARRFADVGQLAAALAPFGNARAAKAAASIENVLRPAPPSTESVIAATAVPTALPRPAPAHAEAPTSRRWLGVVILAGLAVGGGGTALLMSQHDEPVEMSPPSPLTPQAGAVQSK
jgi:eukaryotic-like serine/threonine-protein kinase